MTESKGIYIHILLLWSLSFLPGCSLEDPVDSDSSPALTLHAEQNLSLITLSWDPVNVTGFKEYILLQSTQDIPNGPVPVTTAETTILKRIDNRSIHSFSASNTLFAERLCYKLYTSVDDRFLYSSTICIDQDFSVFNGFNDRVGHEEGSDKIVMFDRVNDRLSVWDYKTETFDWSLDETFFSFPVIDVSTYEQTTNAFVYDQSPARVRKYRFPELTPLTYKDFGSVLFAVAVHNQFVFTSSDDFGKTFQVLNRSNFNTIDSRSAITGNRNIGVFAGEPLVVIEIGETSMMKYSINASGQIFDPLQINTGVSQMSTQNTTAQSDDYFIGGRRGDMINRNGELVGSLISDINSVILFNRFSTDKSKVISVVSTNVKTSLDIFDISGLPIISKLQSYELPQATYSDVMVEDHIIYVVGVTFTSGQSQTFIYKYPI